MYPVLKGLSAKAMYSYDYKDNDWKNYVRTYSLYKYDTGNDTYNEYVKNTPSKSCTWIWQKYFKFDAAVFKL